MAFTSVSDLILGVRVSWVELETSSDLLSAVVHSVIVTHVCRFCCLLPWEICACKPSKHLPAIHQRSRGFVSLVQVRDTAPSDALSFSLISVSHRPHAASI